MMPPQENSRSNFSGGRFVVRSRTQDELERVNIYHEDEPKVAHRRTSLILDDLLSGRMDIEELRRQGLVNF